MSGTPVAYTAATYGYDTIGNLTSKGGYTYKYPAATTAHPHAVTCTNWLGTTCATGASYQYDDNGNMESGGGRTYLWSAENQPLRVVKNGVAEDYLYNADNERVRVTVGGDHTFSFGAGGEETGTTKRHAYAFNGQVIAERDVPGTTSAFPQIPRSPILLQYTDRLKDEGAV